MHVRPENFPTSQRICHKNTNFFIFDNKQIVKANKLLGYYRVQLQKHLSIFNKIVFEKAHI